MKTTSFQASSGVTMAICCLQVHTTTSREFGAWKASLKVSSDLKILLSARVGTKAILWLLLVETRLEFSFGSQIAFKRTLSSISSRLGRLWILPGKTTGNWPRLAVMKSTCGQLTCPNFLSKYGKDTRVASTVLNGIKRGTYSLLQPLMTIPSLCGRLSLASTS